MKTPQLKEVVDYFFVEKTEPDDEVVFDKEVIEFVARVPWPRTTRPGTTT